MAANCQTHRVEIDGVASEISNLVPPNGGFCLHIRPDRPDIGQACGRAIRRHHGPAHGSKGMPRRQKALQMSMVYFRIPLARLQAPVFAGAVWSLLTLTQVPHRSSVNSMRGRQRLNLLEAVSLKNEATASSEKAAPQNVVLTRTSRLSILRRKVSEPRTPWAMDR